MHARWFLALALIAGCTGTPAPGPTDLADHTVAQLTEESWYVRYKLAPDNETVLYLLEATPRDGAGGTAGPCCNLSVEEQDIDLGTFTGGPRQHLPAGTPFQFRLHYTCFHPAAMTVRVTVLASGQAIAEAEASKVYVGMFLPVHIEDVFEVDGTLTQGLGPDTLSVAVRIEGCPLMSVGMRGSSASGIHFKP